MTAPRWEAVQELATGRLISRLYEDAGVWRGEVVVQPDDRAVPTLVVSFDGQELAQLVAALERRRPVC